MALRKLLLYVYTTGKLKGFALPQYSLTHVIVLTKNLIDTYVARFIK